MWPSNAILQEWHCLFHARVSLCQSSQYDTPARYEGKLDGREGDGLGKRGKDCLGRHVRKDGGQVPDTTKRLRLSVCVLASMGLMLTYDELRRQRCLQRIRNLMRILADAAFPCPYCLEGLAETLLAAVSVRGPCIRVACEAHPHVFARLPPVRRGRIAVCVRSVVGTGAARGTQAQGLLLVRWKQIRLEGGELESGVRPSIPSVDGGH